MQANKLEMMLEVWREIFQEKNLHEDDDFFEMGGHSILSAKLIAKIEEKFKVTLTKDSLWEHSTPKSIFSHMIAKE